MHSKPSKHTINHAIKAGKRLKKVCLLRIIPMTFAKNIRKQIVNLGK